MTRKLALLLTSLSPILLLLGCAEGGGGLDIIKITQNPFVMVIVGILIVYWMMKRSK